MAAAFHFNALKAGEQASGYMPGEAAAFVLIERAGSAGSNAGPALVRLGAAGLSFDEVGRASGKAALGVGLASAISTTLEQRPDLAARVRWMLGDLNGDAFRANDWGHALVRLLPDHQQLGDCLVTLPAESFGEVGAAAGPAALCMAVRAYARRYAGADTALVWLSSYRGHRGAFLLQQAA
jgi:3-oxoacyl-[acyl-carrier-protein] synthase-1